MDNTSLKQIVEGLIFAADEPLTPNQIRDLVEGESTNGTPQDSSDFTPQKIRVLVDDLNSDYERYSRPYRIQAVAGGYIFATNRDVSTFVGKLHKEQSKKRLTQASLETLAIIAYKQPMTKVELETIRGVNSDYIVKSLLEKDLIAIVGREQTPGRPLLYGTTKRFLMHFGLNSINELPKPREIEELIGETELEVEKRMMELEKQRVDEEEEASKKRERKPHPLSEGATAKIIPLKPDYRPFKKYKPDSEEEEPETIMPEEKGVEEEQKDKDQTPVDGEPTKEADQTTATQEVQTKEREEITEPEQPEDTHEPVEHDKEKDMQEESPGRDEAVEETTESETYHEEEHVDEPETDYVAEQRGAEPTDFGQGEDKPQRGWKKWKNKIVTIIKKIFG